MGRSQNSTTETGKVPNKKEGNQRAFGRERPTQIQARIQRADRRVGKTSKYHFANDPAQYSL